MSESISIGRGVTPRKAVLWYLWATLANLPKVGCYRFRKFKPGEFPFIFLCTVRSALSTIAHVEIDERDLSQLELIDDAGGDNSPVTVGNVRRFTADQVVQVATIDTFQGCEAEIVILSTVRNQGPEDSAISGQRASIGFLKVSVLCELRSCKADPLPRWPSRLVPEPNECGAFTSSRRTFHPG